MKKLAWLVLLILPFGAFASGHYKSGKISNLTAVTSGIMIMMDSGLPSKCAGSPYGWMKINQEYTAISSVVLTAWAAGKTSGTVYVSGRENGTGYCIVTQFDPAG
ncbi:hypothetical protein CW749_05085 [Vibrio sp. vnigr-6D03]|uniref:hypothetical protein n=1 Tax=Vibrio sp. vnigr-6D03 TaxID=2058088 RepID=UPI000C33DA6F|nr:hypothetical protein [Vibrio sp. vnigr-6D03]PKF80715.1 hypothetical protein CW749_05085 [Vibrio sp. vnigr-6D03]